MKLKNNNFTLFNNSGPSIIIAEISGNHNGNKRLFLDLIKSAFKNGADMVKIQTYEPSDITLNKKMNGPDHKASLNPEEFIDFVEKIRNIEKMRGSYSKSPTAKEKKILTLVRKSIVARTQISKGELFSEKNITTKRAKGGSSAINFYKVSKKKRAKRNYKVDDIIVI